MTVDVSRLAWCALGLFVAAVAPASGQGAGAAMELILQTGEPAPQGIDGTVFALFGATINSSGQLGLTAAIETGPDEYKIGVWRGNRGDFELLESTGSPAPDWGHVTFSYLNMPNIADNGDVAVVGEVVPQEDPGGRRRGEAPDYHYGQWVYRADGSNELVVVDRFPAPDRFGSVMQDTVDTTPVINSAGNVFVDLSISDGTAMLYEVRPGFNEILVDSLVGPIPGLPGGVVQDEIGFFELHRLCVNGNGGFAFGRLIPRGISGIWYHDADGLDLLMAEDAPLPGGGRVVRYLGSASKRINDQGEVLTLVQFSDFPQYLHEEMALILTDGESTQVIAEDGSPAPGIPGAVIDLSWVHGASYVLNARGNVAFAAWADDGIRDEASDEAIWTDVSGSLDLLLREGAPAPGAEPARFAGGFFVTPMITMNAPGQIVYAGQLTGEGVTAEDNRGLWYANPGEPLELLLRTGDAVEVPGVGTKTLLGFGLSRYDGAGEFHGGGFRNGGGQDGFPRSLNDEGELVVFLEFTDETSALVLLTLPTASGDGGDPGDEGPGSGDPDDPPMIDDSIRAPAKLQLHKAMKHAGWWDGARNTGTFVTAYDNSPGYGFDFKAKGSEKGMEIRVYANEVLIAQATPKKKGVLLESNMSEILVPGTYSISASHYTDGQESPRKYFFEMRIGEDQLDPTLKLPRRVKTIGSRELGDWEGRPNRSAFVTAWSNTDGRRLGFLLGGIPRGAEARVYAGDILIARGVAGSRRMVVETDGETPLPGGESVIGVEYVWNGRRSARREFFELRVDAPLEPLAPRAVALPADTNPELDVNRDGVVNAADAAIVLQQLGLRGVGIAADVNGDGEVSTADLEVLSSALDKRQPTGGVKR